MIVNVSCLCCLFFRTFELCVCATTWNSISFVCYHCVDFSLRCLYIAGVSAFISYAFINKVCNRGWWSISFRVPIRSFLCDHIELQAVGCFLHRRNSLMWLSWTKPSFSSIAGNALACFLDQLQWHFNPYFTSWRQKKKGYCNWSAPEERTKKEKIYRWLGLIHDESESSLKTKNMLGMILSFLVFC